MKKIVADLGEFNAFAREFAADLAPHAGRATLVTLSGDLGAGKTTFSQAIARSFGVADDVTSPTFVIEKIYELDGQRFDRLIHMDAYRLKSAHEMRVIGFEETLREPHNLILLEWPERVALAIPPWAIAARFDMAGDGRIITVDGNEEKSG